MLAAAAIALPEPIDMSSWLSAADYPKHSEVVAERGYVIYQLTVSPEGRVVRCDTLQRSTIGLSVCNALEARATFKPATDKAGQPIFAIYENMKAFRLEGLNMPPRPLKAGSILTLDRMPAGVSDPFDVKLALLVDAAGKVIDCRPVEDSSNGNDAASVLNRLACAETVVDPRQSAQDSQGKSVVSVQSITVRFQTKAVASD
ncbi:hypothetical protein [Sphingomonas montanisoli]|uniref:hypothetical protein n=1 Tax=Sphingomonas montanisoli TaxID=2606412 RepID=UPI0015E16F7F|nr:hypothetical protein [Sphingomonas montanisoli]